MSICVSKLLSLIPSLRNFLAESVCCCTSHPKHFQTTDSSLCRRHARMPDRLPLAACAPLARLVSTYSQPASLSASVCSSRLFSEAGIRVYPVITLHLCRGVQVKFSTSDAGFATENRNARMAARQRATEANFNDAKAFHSRTFASLTYPSTTGSTVCCLILSPPLSLELAQSGSPPNWISETRALPQT